MFERNPAGIRRCLDVVTTLLYRFVTSKELRSVPAVRKDEFIALPGARHKKRSRRARFLISMET